MPQEIPHFIDGARVPGRSGRTAPVYNPATGEETGAVALASGDEVEAAVASAKAAAPGWAKTT
ncbi:aldehyde dehydrogenase family protein, partial [Methylorubrum sp. Q1]|uniref:aldehyde dehydrogenase family protein n=1 Tax=Methylorubrum sp. Q1 TaxID=2562453 RepID=UPI0010768766